MVQFPDDIESDSIPTSHATKSICSTDSINTLSNHTVQSERNSKSDSIVIASTTVSGSSGDSEGNDKKKVSRL